MKQDHDHDPLAQVARRLLQDSEQFIDTVSAMRLSAARRPLPRVDRSALDDDALDYATAHDAAIYEDLEFYLWADELDPAGSPRSPS